MMLSDLIVSLERRDAATPVAHGFGGPHSYRGYYECLGFEPVENTTVGKMLAAARSALGTTFTAYKGGEYTMDKYTDVYLAEWGRTGDAITEHVLVAMIDVPQQVALLREALRWAAATLQVLADHTAHEADAITLEGETRTIGAVLDAADAALEATS